MTSQNLAAGVLAWLENEAQTNPSLRGKMGGYFANLMFILRPIAAGTHVLVPVEITDKIIDVWSISDPKDGAEFTVVWQDMLTASQEQD